MKPELNKKDQTRQKKLRKMLASGLPLSALLTGLLGTGEVSAAEPRLVGKICDPKPSVKQEQTSGKQPEPKPLMGEPLPPKPVIRGVPPAPVSDDSYKVRQGDTLHSIAKQHGTTVENLKKLNGISDRSASSLKAGQKIRIR